MPTERSIHRAGRHLALGALGFAVGALACAGDDGTGPVPVASVAVTSPIGGRLAVGHTVQLSTEARDARGRLLPNVTLTWSSSAPGVAQVNASGLVSGAGAGPATISAQASAVTGSLDLQVIAADLGGITTALNDPFTSSLLANLSSAVRTRLQAALEQCANGAAQGNFTTIETCLSGARAEVAGATDPTDRALLANLALFFDYVERLLGA